MALRHLKFSLLLLLTIVAGPWQPALANLDDTTHPGLQPEAVHSETLSALAKTLRFGHYKKRYLDDELSAELLEAQIYQLDRAKLYFLQSDIDSFAPLRDKFDDAIRAGDAGPAFTLYNRYHHRAEQRLQYLLELIELGLDKLDFGIEETIATEREHADWAKTEAELDELWRKQLKSTVLSLKLSDKNLDEIAEVLQKRYSNQLHRLRQATPEDAFSLFANAFTGLYDPHTQYFSPRTSENFNINMRLSLEGIGAVLQSQDEHTKVVRLIPAGPADKQGQLKPADLIVGVAQGDDGEMIDVVGWRLDEVVDLIRGPKGSTVRLEVNRTDANGKTNREISIVRNKVKLEEQAAQKAVLQIERDGQTRKLGVISIPTFYIDFRALQAGDPDYRSTTRDVETLLNELIEEGVEGLVIDLRNNGGGSLREAVELTGLFIPQGPVVQIKDAWGRIRIESDHDDKAFNIPLAVMVNRLSASASEIFAGAIKDYDRGLIIGNSTYGKGTVQALHPLEHGQLKLTQQMFYRISGVSTQNKGVVPHIQLPEIYDPEKVGESTETGALPWDKVNPLPHNQLDAIEPALISILEQKHQQRVESEPDLIAIREEVEHRREQQRNQMPLNEQALRQLREANEARQLEIENRRRQAKELPPLTSLAELESERANVHNDIDPEKDPLLRESSEVLIDYLSIQTTAMH